MLFYNLKNNIMFHPLPNKVLMILAFFFSYGVVTGQKYLQIEMINDPVTIKIQEGEIITYKLHDSEEWITSKINRFLVEEKAIVMEDGFARLEDISYIMRYRPVADYIGKGLMTFGTGWLVYGGIAAVGADFDFGGDTLLIGGGSFFFGWLIRKLFNKKPLHIGHRYRLRLLDLSLK